MASQGAAQEDWSRELAVAREAAVAAAEVLRRHYREGSETWEKGEDDPVTAADLEANEVITRILTRNFPDDGLLSEETAATGERLAKRRVWIVDPMDGTKEFVKRIPEFAVSIALVQDGEPVVGVILNPLAEVCLWATRGGGSFRDGAPIRVSQRRSLRDAVMIASRSETARGQLEPYADWFGELRPTGSIAWKLAVVASGDGDLNVSFAPKNEWDVCAGDLLVREAGGGYVDAAGRTRRYNQADTLLPAGMAAGPAALLEAFFAREAGRR